MSFMFNPYPFDDTAAVNTVTIPDEFSDAVLCGTESAAKTLAEKAKHISDAEGSCILAIDGYAGAEFIQLTCQLQRQLTQLQTGFQTFDAADLFMDARELEKKLEKYLPNDRIKDPVLLYGRPFKEGFEGLFDPKKLENLKKSLQEFKKRGGGVAVVAGNGSLTGALRGLCDVAVYLDVTPKQAILNVRRGHFRNFGDHTARPVKEALRRCYYVDFETSMSLRGELLKEGGIDYYLCADNPDVVTLLPKAAFEAVMKGLVKQPFRCKPVYLEGVWGGQFFKRLRHLPEKMKNSAWVFDMIPLEVSILADTGKNLLEFPFHTFVQKEGEAMMGRECVQKFDGYFPVRFNYDDTMHGGGNMSIQVHPGEAHVKENFDEFGRQDESYYVVAASFGAKTYLGMKNGADADAFFRAIKNSERTGEKVEHDDFVNAVPSAPGTQVMIPAGTIHASGRNQVVLEIGSLTVGSYTFKLYDYLRKDLDGLPRPIHSYYGEQVLQRERNADWVAENVVQQPRTVRQGEGWRENIVGEHDLLYFSLRTLEFEKEIEDDTKGQFHVLTLVDGEHVSVQSVEHPEYRYEQSYLDIVVVPANIGKYRIVNQGNHPIVIHKTMLKGDGADEQ